MASGPRNRSLFALSARCNDVTIQAGAPVTDVEVASALAGFIDPHLNDAYSANIGKLLFRRVETIRLGPLVPIDLFSRRWSI